MPTWGRGGAGNIMTDAQVEEENKRIAADLEAQQSTAESTLSPSNANFKTTISTSSLPSTTQPQPQQYALTGRGGAGNWYSPRDLASQGTFTSTSTTSTSTNPPTSTNDTVPDPALGSPPNSTSTSFSRTPSKTSSTGLNVPPPPTADFEAPGHRGRGGVGNYVWEGQREEEEKLRREKQERDREAEVREKAEKDVEAGLVRPGRVVLEPGGRVGSGVAADGGEGEGWREWV